MTTRITELLDIPLIRYILVGGTAYIIEISFIYFLIYLGIHEIIAVAVGFWVGFIVAFFLQKIFAFRNKAKSIKHVAKQTILYSILVAVNYIFTLLTVSLLSPVVGLLIARTIALLVTTIWNYFIYKELIFKQQKEL
jgi:putative flippase GtrA